MVDLRPSVIQFLTVLRRAILHDPEQYPEPEEFKPERFLKNGVLDPTVQDPNSAAFGYGRRYVCSLQNTSCGDSSPRLFTPSICPGRHLSNNSLYAVVSSVLAVFDIKPPLDANGKPSRLNTDVTSGLLSYDIQLC